MPDIYSERFIHRWGGPGGVSYIVPSSKRAVLKSVTVYNGDTAAAVMVLTLNGQGIWARSIPGPSGGYSEAIMVVAYAGEGFQLYGYGPNSGGTVSGYLFDDVEGRQAPEGQFSAEVPPELERRAASATPSG